PAAPVVVLAAPPTIDTDRTITNPQVSHEPDQRLGHQTLRLGEAARVEPGREQEQWGPAIAIAQVPSDAARRPGQLRRVQRGGADPDPESVAVERALRRGELDLLARVRAGQAVEDDCPQLPDRVRWAPCGAEHGVPDPEGQRLAGMVGTQVVALVE